MMQGLLKNFLLFVLCTAAIFIISYGALMLIYACENGKLDSPPIDSVATAIFMLFCFPLWILWKGASVSDLDTSVLMVELLLDASFYGLILSTVFSFTLQRKKRPRRSVE